MIQPPEVYWAGNDFLTWIEDEYGITMENWFDDTNDGENFELVMAELKQKLDK